MKKKSTKKPKYPIHKMGQTCGYEEFEDGSIEIAPGYSKTFNELLTRETNIRTLLSILTQQCADLLFSVTKGKQDLWEDLKTDYNLDLDKFTYSYTLREKKIVPKKKETETE